MLLIQLVKIHVEIAQIKITQRALLNFSLDPKIFSRLLEFYFNNDYSDVDISVCKYIPKI